MNLFCLEGRFLLDSRAGNTRAALSARTSMRKPLARFPGRVARLQDENGIQYLQIPLFEDLNT